MTFKHSDRSTSGARRRVRLGALSPRKLGVERLEDRCLLSISQSIPAAVWLEQGPGPITGGQVEGLGDNRVSGAIQAIAPHPFNPAVAYVGTANGGVWRTTNLTNLNGSPTWEPTTDQMPSLSIGALAMSPFDRRGAQVQAGTAVDDLVLYAGTGSFSSSFFGQPGVGAAGVLRSTDGGAHWSVLGAADFQGLRIRSVVASASDANVILVGTDDATRVRGGLYRSTDGGEHWTRISGTLGLPRGSISDLVADPGNPMRLYAAISGNFDFNPTAPNAATNNDGVNNDLIPWGNKDVFRSDDADLHWTRVVAGITLLQDANGFDDDGDGTADPADPAEGINLSQRIRLAVSAAAPNPIYAGIIGHVWDFAGNYLGRQLTGLFRSTGGTDGVDDDGDNIPDNPEETAWVALSLPSTPEAATDGQDNDQDGAQDAADPKEATFYGLHPGGQGTTNFSLAADPSDPAVLYVGGDRQPVTVNNFAGTTDWVGRLFIGRNAGGAGGTNWFPIVGRFANGTAPHADSRAIVFDAAGNILEADDGGIFKLATPSTVNRFWTNKNGDLRTNEVYSVAYDPLNDVILAGTQDTGSVQQNDHLDNDGDSLIDAADPDELFYWGTVAKGDGTSQATAVIDDNTVVRYSMPTTFNGFRANTYDARDVRVAAQFPLLESSAGAGYLSGLNPADRNTRYDAIVQYEVNKVNPQRLLLGKNGLYESLDRGEVIRAVNLPSVTSPYVGALAYGGFKGTTPNAGVIYEARGNVVRVRSRDGQPFIRRLVTAPLAPGAANTAAGPIVDLVLKPDDWETVYAVDATRIFRSSDAGVTWSDITGTLRGRPGLNLRTIEVIPTVSGDLAVAVGGSQGVFYEVNPGEAANPNPNWTQLGQLLPRAMVSDLRYDARDDVLAAGTLGRGAWKITRAEFQTSQTVVLSILGDDPSFPSLDPGKPQDDLIRLRRDPADPRTLQVFVNNTNLNAPDFTAPLAGVRRIEVSGLAGDDRLIVDSSFGLIDVPERIQLQGGAAAGGGNVLELLGGAGQKQVAAGGPAGSDGDVSIVSGEGSLQSVFYWDVAAIAPQFPPSGVLGGLKTVYDGLVHTTKSSLAWVDQVQNSLPALRGSLGRAINWVGGPEASAGHDLGGERPAGPDLLGGTASSLLRRVFETGANGFPLEEIGTQIDSPQALRDRLDALDDTIGNVTLTELGGVTTYDVCIETSLSGTADLGLDLLAGAIDVGGTVGVGVDVDVHLIFGEDPQGFFVDTQNSSGPEFLLRNLRFTGDAQAEGRIGFLGVTLSAAALTLDPSVQLSVDLADPQTDAADGKIRVLELGAPLADFVHTTVQGNPTADDLVLTGTFQVAAAIPGLPAPFEIAGGEISFTWADITDPARVAISAQASGGEELLRFLNVTAGQVLEGLNQFSAWLGDFRGTSVFNTPIPFAQGHTLATLLDLQDALARRVTDHLQSASGEARFFTVQDLAASLPMPVGLDYDPQSHVLAYQLTLTHIFDSVAVPVDFSAHLGELAEVNTTSVVNVAREASLGFTFGVDLTSVVSSASLADALFIEQTSLDGAVTMTAPDIDATARLGPLGIHVADGAGTASAAIAVQLRDPATQTPGGRLSLRELSDALANISTIVVPPTIQTSARLDLPIHADPFSLGTLTVALSGGLTLTQSGIDYSLLADIAGELLPGLEILAPSRVTWSKSEGMDIDAHARVLGVALDLMGEVHPTADFVLSADADPFALGNLTVDLAGTVSRTASLIDYRFEAAVLGEILPGLVVEERSPGNPSVVTLTKADGLEIDARARAFGVGLNITGDFQATDDFSLAVTADPLDVGSATVNLSGTLSRSPAGLDWSLSATVANWQPVPFLTVDSLAVSLGPQGIRFETTADIAGINDIHLQGDFRFDDKTYQVTADAAVDWTPVEGVNLTGVLFTITNRNPDDSPGGTRIEAAADLSLFGTDFLVVAQVTSLGSWIAATPAHSWSPVPGLQLDYQFVVASSYDFVIQIDTQGNEVGLSEVPSPPDPLEPNQRQVKTGISLVAAAHLPEAIPMIGGSEVQVAGLIGTSLADMFIEAKIVLGQPWILSVGGTDVLAFDALGLEITGQPSLTVFGDGRILREAIPDLMGVDQDIALRARLSLTPTELSGSLSLIRPVYNLLDIEGLDIIEADVSVGISFVATPVPPPTIGLNFLVELPQQAQDMLSLPATVGAALKVSNTEPILAMTVVDWKPFHVLGIDEIVVNEGSLVIAPNGGTIGSQRFDRGFSASFDAEFFGTDVGFLGAFDEQTRGFRLEAYVGSFSIGGIAITGPGPDGQYQTDADNGAYFRAVLTPAQRELYFDGMIRLPVNSLSGAPALIVMRGNFTASGVTLDGTLDNWEPVPAVVFDGSVHAEVAFQTVALELAFTLDTSILGDASVHFDGSLSASPQGFDLHLTSEIRMAGLMNLEATIDVGTDSPFSIALAGDLTLPGTTPGRARIEGAIGSQGVSAFGRIDNWMLLPGLSFEGQVSLLGRADGSQLVVALDADADLLGSRLHVDGEVVAAASGPPDMLLNATIVLTVPRVRLVEVELSGTIDTRQGLLVRLGGSMDVFGSKVLDLDATLRANGDDWLLRLDASAGFHFSVPVVDDDVGSVELDFQFAVGLEFGSNVTGGGNFVFEVDLDGKAKATVANQPLFDSSIGVDVRVDLDAGKIIILDADPHWSLENGISWDDLRLGWGNSPPPPTVTAQLVNQNTLSIRGLGDDEKVVVSRVVTADEDKLVVSVNDWRGGMVDVLEVPTLGVVLVDVDTGGGDDYLDIRPEIAIATILQGGTGDDQIRGGDGPDEIRGGDGNDRLYGREGNDRIFGDRGSDRLLGGAGDDQLDGGQDDDTLYGGNHDDTLLGSDGDDAIYGDASELGIDLGDVVPGADYIDGGAGSDVVYAGGASNRVFGGSGNDSLWGEDGDDELHGEDGDDHLDGGPNADFLFGEAGDDVLLGAQGDDRLTGGLGNDTMQGGAGSDLLVYAGDADIVLGDAGLLGPNVDTLGGIERAELTGGPGDNVFDLSSWSGTAAVVAGEGLDTLVVSGDADFSLSDSLLTRSGSGAVELAGFERAYLAGGPGNNRIDAAAFSGQATLLGHGGDDTLLGGSGDDYLDGGTGTDILVGVVGNDELVGGGGAGDTLEGGEGDDLLRGSDDGSDVLRGGPGRDRLLGNRGNDAIEGGPDDDILDGGPGDDIIVGDAGSDLIVGGADHDALYGHNADTTGDDGAVDYVYGDFGTGAGEAGSGRDRLFGGGGNDLLFGEGEDDFIDPGSGSSNLVDYGGGESAVPSEFLSPIPTPPPDLGSGQPVDPVLPPRVWQRVIVGPRAVPLGDLTSGRTVYYVNDGTQLGDAITTAIGSLLSNGLTPDRPLPSIQAVRNAYDLRPGDVILVDAGQYPHGITLTARDAGLLILGAAGSLSTIAGPILIGGATGATIQNMNLAAGVTVRRTADVKLLDNVIAGAGVTLDGASATQLVHNRITVSATGVTLTGGTSGLVTERNLVVGGSRGIETLEPADGRIADNEISGAQTGLRISAAFSGPIEHNEIHGGTVGVAYAAAAELGDNLIHHNSTGIVASVADVSAALGFVGSMLPNHVFANATGVQLAGRMQGQHLYGNVTGVAGSGILGGDDLDDANLIEKNTTGVRFAGTIQFNRVARNTVGIAATSGQLIAHNLIYRNSSAGVRAAGTAGVRILNNTFYAPQGDNVRLEGGTRNAEIRNNVLWAQSGYDIFVADDSQAGFTSDYNDLHASGTGRLVHWIKDFRDVLDWQADLARFDLHSIGRTEVNPLWSEPRFAGLARDDFRMFDAVAGLRFSSPTVDAGDPATAESLVVGGPDLGATGNTRGESGATAAPRLALRAPDLYVDWERDRPHTIR